MRYLNAAEPEVAEEMREIAREWLTCKLCGKIFGTGAALKRHKCGGGGYV